MEIKAREIKMVDIDHLIENPKNNNKHPDDQIERLVKIIKNTGFRNPLTVSNRSGFVLCGHGRISAARKAGLKELPVIFQDFKDEAEEYAHLTADNAIAKWAEIDLGMVNSEMLDLGPDFDIDMLGLKDFVIEPIEKFDPQSDEDEVPEVVNPITVRGDIWILGNHRLMCGDSTMIDDVEKLMNGEKADMVFTDPPYGVDYDGGALSKREKLRNDDSTDIYDGVLPVLYAFTGEKAPFYIWHAAGYADMASKLGENNFKIRSQIIWNKNKAQFGALSAQYKQKHEPCFYCHKKNASPYWYGPTNEVTVWDIKRESKNEHHPTQKPIELVERALLNSSLEKNLILDLFGGSGSTLLACQKTSRTNNSMELNEKYCDVIINRWQNYTGKQATLESTGQTYEELKAVRNV
jgi:DNA modification methylase